MEYIEYKSSSCSQKIKAKNCLLYGGAVIFPMYYIIGNDNLSDPDLITESESFKDAISYYNSLDISPLTDTAKIICAIEYDFPYTDLPDEKLISQGAIKTIYGAFGYKGYVVEKGTPFDTILWENMLDAYCSIKSPENLEPYIASLAYELYKNAWCKERGFHVQEWSADNGFNGESYAGFPEFVVTEYQMRTYRERALCAVELELWDRISFSLDGDALAQSRYGFEKGTPCDVVYNWLEDTFPISIAQLRNGVDSYAKYQDALITMADIGCKDPTAE